MSFVQQIIHRIDTAGSSRVFRAAMVFLAIVLLGTIYNLRSYRNMASREAMDAAQLGRNIAEGRGYTTQFVRPFSIHLVAKQNPSAAATDGDDADASRLASAHPDIANPPVYPVILAGLMKVLPFNFTGSPTQSRYQPDFLIALFNQVVFLGLVIVTFFWARRQFDGAVAWTATAVLLGTELLWRFTVSGLSTLLLLLIFMGLVACLSVLENEAREPKRGPKTLFALAIAAGVLVGVGGLTRYAFLWLILPVLAFIILFAGSRRGVLCFLVLCAFLAVTAPWIVRNVGVSGVPFGTASYQALQDTMLFPDDRLQRSLEPNIQFFLRPVWMKLLGNLREMVRHDWLMIGGGWITALFLVGLLVEFRNPTVRRMRYFLLLSFGLLVLVEGVARTQASDEVPSINGENLLVLFVPLVVVYSVSFFYLLLDRIAPLAREGRAAIIGLFVILACLPMLLGLLSPRLSPLAYPPYLPPQIRNVAGMMDEQEWIMSDVPWAVAWYGNRQSVWLTLNAAGDPADPDPYENFFAVHKRWRPVSAVYLTPRTIDGRLLSDWIDSGQSSWGSFVLDVLLHKEVPSGFPLRQMPAGYLPHTIFIADRQRW